MISEYTFYTPIWYLEKLNSKCAITLPNIKKSISSSLHFLTTIQYTLDINNKTY